MKVITDKAVNDFLNKNLSKKSLLEKFQPALLSGLVEHARDPHKIVPPRIAQASNNPDSDTTHIYMPCISPKEVGIKVISGGPGNNAKGLGFQGCVLIMNEITGVLEAVLNANTLTAFRTALASSLGLTKVIDVDSSEILPELTVFGVGLQAYWHVKLALALYECKITTVNILNRTLKNAEILKEKLSAEFGSIKFNSYSYEHEASGFIPRVQNSSIIFGCTPATTPIIKQDYLNKDKKFPKFISLIGSYKPHMIELDLQLCKEFKANGVSIIVDSKEHTLHEAGELIQAGYTAEQLIEIQQLYEPQQLNYTKITEDLSNITVQKIVGLSIMDLSMGKLITHAITNEDSVYIEDF